MKTATHDGHCQCCGRLQRLPGGKLAKHGYEVIGRGNGYGGYFSGTCYGSGELPYELSCELVKEDIQRAKKHRHELKHKISDLLAPASEPKAFFRHYFESRYFGKSGYYAWIEVTLTREDKGTYRETIITFKDGDKVIKKSGMTYGFYGDDLLKIADDMNAQYAKALEKDVAQLTAHIAFQQERVTNWKLAPLIERKLART